MIIDCAVYRHGERLEAGSDHERLSETYAGLGDDEFLWVALADPAAHELDLVGDALSFHHLTVEDSVEAHQRAKIEPYGDYLFGVVKTLSYDDGTDQVDTGELNVFLGERFLVSVRHGEVQDFRPVREHASTADLAHGPSAAFHLLLDAVVDRYAEVAAGLEADVEEVESSVFSDERSSDSRRIYELKREALEVRRAVAPLREPLQQVVLGRYALVPLDVRAYFRDVLDHLNRVADVIESVDHLLANALDAHQAQLSLQQNDDMRTLAAYAAMFAAPTLVAGVYGMNFQHMPELAWRYGYPICVLVMVAVVIGLYVAFRRSGWLGGASRRRATSLKPR